jgi:hypothetical protein
VIVERIVRHLQAPSVADFDLLSRDAFAFQFERIAPYRAMCERAGRTPETVATFREVPMVPATAFASVELAAGPAIETFRSSGTLGGSESPRSVHHHPYPELYRAVVDATFPAALLPAGGRPPMLALVPPREVAPDSSLAFMVAHVLERFGGAGSIHAFGARGVEGGKARSWLSARQREGQPVLLLATSFALADLLDFLGRIDLKFRLPAGSTVMETGGFKGRAKSLSPDELHARLEQQLGIPPEAVVGEYGMTELTSQAYTRPLQGDESGLFHPPPWMKVRALDPLTLEERPPGREGLLAIFDLANVGSALHLLTEDLGAVENEAGAFRLAGRAPEADLRGCSLLAEALGSR